MRKVMLYAAGLLVAAACAKMETEIPDVTKSGEVWTATVEAVRGVDTRSLAEDGSAIFSFWGGLDEVKVYDAQNAFRGSLYVVDPGGENTVLSGQLSGTFTEGDRLRLYLLGKDPSYERQKGTLEDVASRFDYAQAEAEVTVADPSAQALSLSPAVFENRQSINLFDFMSAGLGDKKLVKLTITGEGLVSSPVEVIPDTPMRAVDTKLYVALSNTLDKKVVYDFCVELEDGTVWSGVRRANLQNGKCYRSQFYNVFSLYDPMATPLTLQVMEAGTVSIDNPLGKTIYYSKGASFDRVSSASRIEIPVEAGDRVILGGYNDVYAEHRSITISNGNYQNEWKYTNIHCDAPHYVYGNVMSLKNAEYYKHPQGYASLWAVGEYAFCRLFKDNDRMYNHPVKTLSLPATTVSTGSYARMFYGCKSLTAAPELPATEFIGAVYDSMTDSPPYMAMFMECTSLKKAPSILPALKVPAYSYYMMFSYCTSLEASPVLPAPNPGDSAYGYMFERCTGLKQIVCYAKANIGWNPRSHKGATRTWTAGVSSTGVFIKDPEASWPTGVNGIPEGWTADAEPLTIEAAEDGTLTVSNPQRLSLTWGKSHALGEAVTVSDERITIPMTAGDKIRFWGDNGAYGGADGGTYLNTHISSDVAHYVYGDIRSLLSSNDFPNVATLPDNAFNGLFSGNAGLRSHPMLDLTMDFSHVGARSCSNMFQGCTGLERSPELPATSLGEFCYEGMFADCTALTEAPELPATTLAPGCYGAMFSGCTGLVSAPALPSTTLAEGCYGNMFDYCLSLTAAPELPATTLVGGCYSYMFRDCGNLTSVTCLAANPMVSDYEADPYVEGNVDGWLDNVSVSGTFTKKAGVAWPSGTIPDGWNVTSR